MTIEEAATLDLNADEILAVVRSRLAELRPLVDECARLEEAERILNKLEPNGTEAAPHGFKPDGTPYKRKPRDPEASRRAVETRRARHG